MSAFTGGVNELQLPVNAVFIDSFNIRNPVDRIVSILMYDEKTLPYKNGQGS